MFLSDFFLQPTLRYLARKRRKALALLASGDDHSGAMAIVSQYCQIAKTIWKIKPSAIETDDIVEMLIEFAKLLIKQVWYCFDSLLN